MNGDEGLDRVLERGLRIGDPAAYPELLGALRTLLPGPAGSRRR